uniref:Uncharacterized protein n=1 Tax=Tetranychus urticae TaxID=32264 RepID=T1K0S5_TETUR
MVNRIEAGNLTGHLKNPSDQDCYRHYNHYYNYYSEAVAAADQDDDDVDGENWFMGESRWKQESKY